MNYTETFQAHVNHAKVNRSTHQGTGHCPFHDDHKPSFSFNTKNGLWCCHGCGEHGNIQQFCRRLNLPVPDSEDSGNIINYTYSNKYGEEIHQVRRFPNKGFAVYHKIDGQWAKGIGEVPRVLYNLPNIHNSEDVFIVEGEKDADTLIAMGFPATTSMGGANQPWADSYTETLTGKNVYIFPDQDEAGKKHANKIALALFGKVSSIRIMNVPKGKDITDWVNFGADEDDIIQLVEATPEFIPSTETEIGSKNLCYINLVTIGELLDRPIVAENWVVENLLSVGGISMLIAKPKVGKSTLARQMALAVSQGTSFLDRNTKRGLVFYLALEERPEDVSSHFRLMGCIGNEDIKVCTDPPSSEMLDKLLATIRRDKPTLIIVDTMIRLIRMKDANDYIQTTKGLEPLMNIAREVGAHICLLHHANKKSSDIDGVLGSTGISATADTIIYINKIGMERSIHSDQRRGITIEKSFLEFDPETLMMTMGGSVEELQEETMKQRISDFLSSLSEPVTEKDIRDNVQGKTYLISHILRVLHADGSIIRSGEGARGDPYLYSMNRDSRSPVLPIGGELGNGNSTNTSSDDSSNVQKQNLDSLGEPRLPNNYKILFEKFLEMRRQYKKNQGDS